MAGGDIVDGQMDLLVRGVKPVGAKSFHLLHPNGTKSIHLDGEVVAEYLAVEGVREERHAHLMNGEGIGAVRKQLLVPKCRVTDVRQMNGQAAHDLMNQFDVVLPDVTAPHLVRVDREHQPVTWPFKAAEIADPV